MTDVAEHEYQNSQNLTVNRCYGEPSRRIARAIVHRSEPMRGRGNVVNKNKRRRRQPAFWLSVSALFVAVGAMIVTIVVVFFRKPACPSKAVCSSGCRTDSSQVQYLSKWCTLISPRTYGYSAYRVCCQSMFRLHLHVYI